MLNVLIAPDSFKGTLSAREVCDIIGEAFENTIQDVKITKLPVADGGEGLCSCLYEITGGSFIGAEVTGVFGEKMTASYLMLDDGTAVIETASCAGLPLAGENKNPAAALTVGIGELIKHAREKRSEENPARARRQRDKRLRYRNGVRSRLEIPRQRRKRDSALGRKTP